MNLRALASIALLCAGVCARAQDPPPGFAGTRVERIDEPVLGGTLALHRAGKPGAPAVLLVHGLGESGARDWATLIPVLASQYEIFAPDLPGFGESRRGDALYSPDNYARVLAETVAPRIGRPFVLIGHSNGAAASLAFAAKYPQRLKSLILVDMAGVLQGGVYADALARNALADRGMPSGALDSMLRGLIAKMSGMAIDRQAILNVPGMRQKVLRGDPNAIAAFALANHDFSQALRAVRTPTLLIWGAEDPIAPPRTGALAASIIPGARLVLLPGVAHVPMAQDPARFNALVLDELAGRTGLAPYAATFTGPPAASAQRCDGEDGKRYSGDIGTLTLIRCNDVDITHARIGELRVLESEVQLVDAQVRGGLYAMRSTLELTAGSVTGGVRLDESEFDAAGTRFEGEGAAVTNLGKLPLTLRLSVVEVARPGQALRYAHDFLSLAPGGRW